MPQVVRVHCKGIADTCLLITEIAVTLAPSAQCGQGDAIAHHVRQSHTHTVLHVAASACRACNRHVSNAAAGDDRAAHPYLMAVCADCRHADAVLDHHIVLVLRRAPRTVQLGQQRAEILLHAAKAEHLVDERYIFVIRNACTAPSIYCLRHMHTPFRWFAR